MIKAGDYDWISIFQGEATCPNSHPLEPMKLSGTWPCLFCGERKYQGQGWACKQKLENSKGACGEYQVCNPCFLTYAVILSYDYALCIFHSFRKTSPTSPKGWRIFWKITGKQSHCHITQLSSGHVMAVEESTAPPIFKPTNANIAQPSRSQAQKHQLLSQARRATSLFQGPQISQSLMQQHWPHLDLWMTFLQSPDQVNLLGLGCLHRVPWTYRNIVPPLWDQEWM